VILAHSGKEKDTKDKEKDIIDLFREKETPIVHKTPYIGKGQGLLEKGHQLGLA